MTAPASRMVPWTAAPSSSLKRARISALVRSSAVRPGARSTQFSPMDTLLMSPMDMSMRPVTSQRPASVTSSPTHSRAALSAVPAALDLT